MDSKLKTLMDGRPEERFAKMRKWIVDEDDADPEVQETILEPDSDQQTGERLLQVILQVIRAARNEAPESVPDQLICAARMAAALEPGDLKVVVEQTVSPNCPQLLRIKMHRCVTSQKNVIFSPRSIDQSFCARCSTRCKFDLPM